jgi:hypothetical protein
MRINWLFGWIYHYLDEKIALEYYNLAIIACCNEKIVNEQFLYCLLSNVSYMKKDIDKLIDAVKNMERLNVSKNQLNENYKDIITLYFEINPEQYITEITYYLNKIKNDTIDIPMTKIYMQPKVARIF